MAEIDDRVLELRRRWGVEATNRFLRALAEEGPWSYILEPSSEPQPLFPGEDRIFRNSR